MSAQTPTDEQLHDLVVVGGSAGGVEALRQLIGGLPPDLPAAVLVVLHLPREGGQSVLPQILGRHARVRVQSAHSGDALVTGTVLVAPPDRHLLVERGRVALSSGPRENGHRPSVDVLFRSAAHEYAGRTIGVVLTGNLDDGSAGLRTVVRNDGLAVVQDPAEAAFPSMPRHALATVPDAHVAPLSELAELVTKLVHTPAPPDRQHPAREQLGRELAASRGEALGPSTSQHPGAPSPFSCPDCSGVLFEIDEGGPRRYRCRVGHAWNAESLVERQDSAVERALWVALRTLEEHEAMARRVAAEAAASGRAWSEQHFGDKAARASRHAEVLRAVLIEDQGEPEPPPRADVPG